MSTAQNLTPKKEVKTRLTAQDIEKMRLKDRELVKGKFIFHEVPGGLMSFSFKAYRGDPVERYDLIDGQIHTLPLGVARHLNKNCWYPEYSYMKGESTQGGYSSDGQVMRVTRKVRRCSFQSLEFVDSDDLTPSSNIEFVENTGVKNTGLHVGL